MEYRILGPLEVDRDGARVTVDAPKQRTLLAVLLLHANDVISRERLVDELWGDHPPATAVKTLHVYVSQLRKALGGDSIVTRRGGYLADIGEDELDAGRFRSLLADARRLVEEGRPADAVALYRRALALWRGDAVSDVPLESLGRADAANLDEQRLEAAEEWIDCELALGRQAQVVSELERLVSHSPYRERLREQLMIALYRTGRQADALAVYRDARRVLVDELGIEPTQRLQDLERAILRHDPALDAPRATRPSEPMRRMRGRVLGALVVAAAVLTAAIVGISQLRDSPAAARAVALAGNSVVVLDPATEAVVGEIPIGGRPGGIAAANGSVWVGNRDAKTLLRIDPSSREIVRTIGLGAEPSGVVSGAGDIWVSVYSNLTVLRVDPSTNEVVARIHVPQGPKVCCWSGAVFGGGAAWIASYSALFRIDAGTNRLERVRQRGWLWGIAYGEARLWLISGVEGDHLESLDPSTGAIDQRIDLGSLGRTRALGILTVGAGAVWLVAGRDTTVWRIDVSTGRVRGGIDIGRAADSAGLGDGALWLATTDRSLARIDLASRRVAATTKLAVYPGPLAVSDGAVWVTTNAP